MECALHVPQEHRIEDCVGILCCGNCVLPSRGNWRREFMTAELFSNRNAVTGHRHIQVLIPSEAEEVTCSFQFGHYS